MHFNHKNWLKKNYYFLELIIFLNLFLRVQPQFIRPVEFSKKEKNQFITKPKDLSISLFEISNSYSNIHIDFGKPQQQVIFVRDVTPLKLKISFQIYSSLPTIYETVKYEFCYQISMKSNPNCYDIPNKDSNVKRFNLIFGVKWLQNKIGLKLEMNPSDSFGSDLSGFYYFKSSTPVNGMILSNFLEIRDKLFWEKNLLKYSLEPIKTKYTDAISPANLPILFPCLDQAIQLNSNDFPYWVAFSFKSIVKWTWCPVSKQSPSMKEIDKTYINDCLRNSISRCEKPRHLCPIFTGNMTGWSESISFNGTITITKGKKFSDPKYSLDGFALMCYHQSDSGFHALRFISNEYDSSEKEFTKGLQWSANDIQRSEFKIISPINQTVRVGILMNGFILNAFYQSPPNYTYEWIRNGKKMFSSQDWLISRDSVKFKSQVTLEMEGYYYLRIKSLSQSYLFTFDLVVVSPPTLINSTKDSILSSVYLMINSSYSISYLYKGDPTHANIYINGIMYRPFISDRKTFLSDLAQKSFNLNHLDFEFFQRQLPNKIMQFTYKVNNVLFPETLLRGQDHSVIIEVANEYGVSRSLLNIYVLKPPKFDNIPTTDNCTSSCSSHQPHLFRCELNSDYYTTREVVVQKFWIANDQRLDVLPHYSQYFKDDAKGLNLMPVKSNDTNLDSVVKLMLKNAKLICRVRLLYPGSENMQEDDLKRENRIIYTTSFAAEIKLDWEPVIVEASYTWIIFLAIALLLIVMFIFLLVKFTLKGQGKSYQIEKLEIAKGYNRDEELIENETIKPYLRSNERTTGCQVDILPIVTVHYRLDKAKAPVVCNKCQKLSYTNNSSYPPNHLEKDSSKDFDYSALNYSPANGNGKCRPRDVLDIIDDEENTIDPSKFNEEGSFIGVYATKNNHSNLPPEIKINNI